MPNCLELAAIFDINLHAALGFLSTNAPSTYRINDTVVSRHHFFIEVLNEQLIRYLIMRALNAQLLKSFPILGESPHEIVESHIFIFLC